MSKPKMMDEKPIRAHVEPEIKRWLERWAHKEHLPVALVIRKILRERFDCKNSK